VSEESILEALKETVSKIKRRNLGGALDTHIYLNFERLMHPIKDHNALLFANPGRDFEPERVYETGEQIRLPIRNGPEVEACLNVLLLEVGSSQFGIQSRLYARPRAGAILHFIAGVIG